MFRNRFGEAPAAVGRAPGRVNLIGEHTDYNQGLCLPIALRQTTAAAIRPRTDGMLHIIATDLGEESVISLDDVLSIEQGTWPGYVAGTVWALREAGYPVGGMDIVLASDVPVGAGLSSSAALEGAVAAAANAAFGLGLLESDEGRRVLAAACQRAENDVVGAPTGGLDQITAFFARADHALELDFQSGAITHVPFTIEDDGVTLLVIDTTVHHSLADGQYAQRRRECDQAAVALSVRSLRDATMDDIEKLSDPTLRRRARHVVSENARVRSAVEAMAARDYEELGRLFVASHESLRDDYEVSAPELDLAVRAAVDTGALGARMTGGGFGGSAIALVPADLAGVVEASVTEAFDAAGFALPNVVTAHAGPGADVRVHPWA